MADNTQSNSAVSWEDIDDFSSTTWDAFAALDQSGDGAFASECDPSVFGWETRAFTTQDISQNNVFDQDDLFADLSSGFVTPDLVTRSNTPNSDFSSHLPPLDTEPNNARTDKPAYRSRLPRRRSVYSRQVPLTRYSSSPQTSIPWSPGLLQNVDGSDMPIVPSPSTNGPLRRSDSTTSMGSECSNSSAHSTASASSATSASRRSSSLGRRQRKRATTTSSANKKTNPDSRPFQCTFCCDAFKNKYDWRRHEKSLHLDLEVWRCAPNDGTFTNPVSLARTCAYCTACDPDTSHLETHSHQACVKRAAAARSFRRRDHLAQHLRVFHKLSDLPQLEDWVEQAPAIKSRCGFCNLWLKSWDERTDHLAGHFRQGCTMRDWQGGHGFDESIAARLTNSLPPYLLATEAKSLVPFSATSAETKDHLAQISARASSAFVEDSIPATTFDFSQPTQTLSPANALQTPALLDSRARSAEAFADILASHLARFALEYKQMGVMVSDDMLQKEARQVLYSSDDPWNQTIADSPMWLKEFRDKHGLN